MERAHTIIRHICLRQQHITLPRHAPRNRMNSKPHINPLMPQHPRNLTNGILRLRNRHSIAHHNNDALSRRECVGCFLDVGFGDRAFHFVVFVGNGRDAAEDDVR